MEVTFKDDVRSPFLNRSKPRIRSNSIIELIVICPWIRPDSIIELIIICSYGFLRRIWEYCLTKKKERKKESQSLLIMNRYYFNEDFMSHNAILMEDGTNWYESNDPTLQASQLVSFRNLQFPCALPSYTCFLSGSQISPNSCVPNTSPALKSTKLRSRRRLFACMWAVSRTRSWDSSCSSPVFSVHFMSTSHMTWRKIER